MSPILALKSLLDIFMNKRFSAQVLKYQRILTLKLFAKQIIKNLWPKVITKSFPSSATKLENIIEFPSCTSAWTNNHTFYISNVLNFPEFQIAY